jgi:hypothetical protein
MVPKGAVDAFLAGDTPGRYPWGVIGRRILRHLLGSQPGRLSPEALAVADRIDHYLFLNHPDASEDSHYGLTEDAAEAPKGAWFFTPPVPRFPTTTREMYALLDRLIHRLDNGQITQLLIARTCAADQLRIVSRDDEDNWFLTQLGERLWRLAEGGAQQVLLLPTTPFASKDLIEASNAFQAMCKDGVSHRDSIHVVSIDMNGAPVRRRAVSISPTQFLHGHFRYVWLRWLEGGIEQARLFVSRKPALGPSSLELDDPEELAAFRDYFAAIVAPRLRDSATGPSLPHWLTAF